MCLSKRQNCPPWSSLCGLNQTTKEWEGLNVGVNMLQFYVVTAASNI